MSRPKTVEEARRILNAVRAGCGKHIPLPIIDFCLALTGDLS
jgi:hypothetical protein